MNNPNPSLPALRGITSGSIFKRLIEEFDFDLSLYNQVMNKIDPSVFDNLQKKDKIAVAGMVFLDGGVIEQKVSLAGRGSFSGDIYTKKLSVAGSATFHGIVGASERSSIAGNATFKQNGYFGGKLSVAGRAKFKKNVVLSGGGSIAGNATINEYLLADSPITVSGNLGAQSIRSNNLLKLDGKLFIEEDVIAKHIILKKVSGVIGGNILSENISTSEEIHEEETKNLQSPIGVFRYIKNILFSSLRGRRSKKLIVEGDILADEMELDNVVVEGNIYCKNIAIGQNAEVLGTIHYEETIRLPENSESDFNIHKGLPESIDQISPN